jgi:hypothetical protein
MNWNGTSSVHLWNVFEDEYGDIDTQGDIIAATPSVVPITLIPITITIPPIFIGFG